MLFFVVAGYAARLGGVCIFLGGGRSAPSVAYEYECSTYVRVIFHVMVIRGFMFQDLYGGRCLLSLRATHLLYPVKVICSSPRAVSAFSFHPTILCENSVVPRNGGQQSTYRRSLNGLPSCHHWTVHHAVNTGGFSMFDYSTV